MSHEQSTAQPDSLSIVQKAILGDLGDTLDALALAQADFFDACRSYTYNISSDQHWDLEQTSSTLEIRTVDVMHAIVASQKYPLDAAKMIYGFRKAEDAMRIAVLRELAPHGGFQTYPEMADETLLENSRQLIREYSAPAVIDAIIDETVRYMRADVDRFAEAAAFVGN